MQYIFDGHNLVFAVRGSGEEFSSLTVEQATQFLCQILEQYLIIKKSKGVLFYDGTGPSDRRFYSNFSRLEVYFAGEFCEADDLIEEEIQENTAPKRLIVVSSDRKIRTAAKRRRAKSVPSMDFWLDVVKQINKPISKDKEPKAKQTGISKTETKYWLKFFKIE